MILSRVGVAAAVAAVALVGTVAVAAPVPQAAAFVPATTPGAEAPAEPDPGAEEPVAEVGDLVPPTAGAPAPVPAPVPPAATPEDAGTAVVDEELDGERRPYPGSPDEEAALVADEDHRLNEVRLMSSLAGTAAQLRRPFRLVTGSSYTLVLPSRSGAYTITDLLDLAPQTFIRQADGTFLLSEHIVVQQGATLQLNAPSRLELRLASDADGFVSIVSYGGRIEVKGTERTPVLVTSWDRQAGAPDLRTQDGRAYIRAIGGQVGMSNVRLTQLGFWSGRTGGLSMTGTDRPNPGALDELGRSITDPGALNGDIPTTTSLDGALPAGDLPLAEYDIDAPRYSYVSVSLNNTATDGNAFGVFVAGANGVDIRGGGFDNSLVDGVTLHRFVTNVVVQATRSTGNGGDGFVLARATTGTILSEVDASRNARNGVTISGLPLASGPTATGTSIGAYGNNAVSNSHAEGNGRYGIEVIGGHDLNVNANDLVGNDMGIVVRGGARAVSVVGNNVTDPTRQGIAVRDGVTDTVVSGNIVSGGETSVYVRASAVEVTRNTLAEASVHGITLVGDAEGTDVQENTISGRGPSAIDYARAESIDPRDFDNELSRWTDTTPWLVTLGRIFQPLNLLWTILGIVVVVTAVRGLRYRGRRAHPYEDKRPVTTDVDVVEPVPTLVGR